MLGLIIFSIIAIMMLIYLYVKASQKEDRVYYIFMLLSSIFVLTYIFIYAIFKETNNIVKVSAYIFSIIIPLIIVVVEYIGYDLSEAISLSLINMYLFFNNKSKAKTILYIMLQKRPESFYLHKKLADISYMEGGFRNALEEYTVAVNFKADVDSYLQISKIYSELGFNDEALQALVYILEIEGRKAEESSTEYSKEYLMILEEIATIYLLKNKYKEALKTYDEILRYTDDETIVFKRACVNILLSNFKEAKVALTQYLEAQKQRNRFNLPTLYLGQIKLLEKEIEEAANLFNSILDDEDLKPYALYELAKIAVYKQEEKKAVEYINEASKYLPNIYEKAIEEPLFYEIRFKFQKPNSNMYLNSDGEVKFKYNLNIQEDTNESAGTDNNIDTNKDKNKDKEIKNRKEVDGFRINRQLTKREKEILRMQRAEKRKQEKEREKFNLSEDREKYIIYQPNTYMKSEREEKLRNLKKYIIEFLSETSSLVTNMNEKYYEEKTKGRVDKIFEQLLNKKEEDIKETEE